jgi:hypothetical protein
MITRQQALVGSPAILGLLAGLWRYRVQAVNAFCDVAILLVARRPST